MIVKYDSPCLHESMINTTKLAKLTGPAQSIVGSKATTLNKIYSYTLNINRIFI